MSADDSTTTRSPQVRSAGFLIYRERPQRQILLMKHADRWDLPKGHVDRGETTLQAALRELQEETGIQPHQIVIDPDFRFAEQYWVNDRRDREKKLKELVIFLARLVDDVPIQPTEHIGYEWVDWSPHLKIQPLTIDPLLAHLARHWNATKEAP